MLPDVGMVCRKNALKALKGAFSFVGSPPGFGLAWLCLSWPMVSFFVATTGLSCGLEAAKSFVLSRWSNFLYFPPS